MLKGFGLILLGILLILPLGIAVEVGLGDSEIGLDLIPTIPINFSAQSSNDSQFLNGFTSGQFWQTDNDQTGLTGNKEGSFNIITTGNGTFNNLTTTGDGSIGGDLRVGKASQDLDGTEFILSGKYQVSNSWYFSTKEHGDLQVSITSGANRYIDLRNKGGADMGLTTDGFIGIGTATPFHPLSFSPELGNKIMLYPIGDTRGYGLGMQGNLLQIFSNGATTRTGIGYGSSGAFTETLSVRGLKIGIRNTLPLKELDIEGDIEGDYINLTGVNSDYSLTAYDDMSLKEDNANFCFGSADYFCINNNGTDTNLFNNVGSGKIYIGGNVNFKNNAFSLGNLNVAGNSLSTTEGNLFLNPYYNVTTTSIFYMTNDLYIKGDLKVLNKTTFSQNQIALICSGLINNGSIMYNGVKHQACNGTAWYDLY